MHDPLGAFCTDQNVQIEGSTSGELSGLSFAAKDVFDIAGFRTGAGNPDWLRTHPPAECTASAVQRLLDAGASLTGKTHTDELTFSLNGENFHYGTPVNPNAPGRVPGGSSSGSASAVASRRVEFALGTDTGGSVRLPASNCGVYGFRPSHGWVPNDHVVPLAPSFDTVGWFARDAEVLARVGRILLPDNANDSDLYRFCVASDAMDLALDTARPALRSALSLLAASMGSAEEITLFNKKAEEWMTAFRILQGTEVWHTHGQWIRENKPAFGPDIRDRFEWAASIDPDQVSPARAIRDQVTEHMNALLGTNTILCIPTAPTIALPKDMGGAELEQFRSSALALLCVAGLAGLPQVSLPLASYESCPLGISLIGPRHSDHQLLALLASIEG
jgi:amidase